MKTPDKDQQIIQIHAGLIVGVVQAIQNPEYMPQMEQVLQLSEQNDWKNLVTAIRKIIQGERNDKNLGNLDDEDRIIVISILKGLQDPSTLPNPEQKADATIAAPMIANLIHSASRGDVNAVSMLGSMAEQMMQAGGDMANMSALMKDLIDGNRDTDQLCEKMGEQGEKLITSIINELHKLEAH